jgi:hypothetical protein
MNIIDCVDFLLRPLLSDTHFVLGRFYGERRRVPSRLSGFFVKCIYDFPLLGATAIASTVSYNIEFSLFRHSRGRSSRFVFGILYLHACFSFLVSIETPSPTCFSVSSGVRERSSDFYRTRPRVSFSSFSLCLCFHYEPRVFSATIDFFALRLRNSVHENHDTWMIERRDSLHCIWRWLATGSTKIYTGVLWRLTLIGISLVMITTRIRGGETLLRHYSSWCRHLSSHVSTYVAV